jgi:hypothetical protein
MNDVYKAKPPANFYRFCLVSVCLMFGFCSDGPDRWDVEPVFLELTLEDDEVLYLKKATLGCDITTNTFPGVSEASVNIRP